MMKKIMLFTLTGLFLLSGCSKADTNANTGKTFTYGTTAYGTAMENAGLDPHNSYMGWSALRYGVGETLFRFNDALELEPWLAESYDVLDEYTIQIQLRDDVTFSNGKPMTGISVKACLEHLVQNHDRAPADLSIEEIEAEGQLVTLRSTEKVTALVNYLCDPYGAIIDVEDGVSANFNVTGTGPYIAEEISPTEIQLKANPDYWDGIPNVEQVTVLSIPDGDTLTMALQSGEIDAAQGLPYSSISLFTEDTYTIRSADTSRLYQAAFNFETEVLQDLAVRQAVCMAINKESFTSVLLNGNGSAAVGAFPSNFSFGNEAVSGPDYAPEKARELLENAGWTDTNGDGYVDKNGENLQLRWLTYTSRQELPLLAEHAQAALKEIGIELIVNATDNYNDFLEKREFDIYAKAFVAAPTGDPQYYFTTHVLNDSAYNSGGYYSDQVESLVEEMRSEFDPASRSALAIEIQQELLDDCAFFFASHLRMSFVMKKEVTGFSAHPSDYYEITAELDITS